MVKMSGMSLTKIVLTVVVLLSEQMLIRSEGIVYRSVATKVSESVVLSCDSQAPWFFCVWEGPRGDRVCSLRSDIGRGGGSMCGGSDRLAIQGKIPTYIGVTIKYMFVLLIGLH